MPQDQQHAVREVIDRCFETCQRQDIEHKLVGGNWLHARIAPILEKGKATKAIIISNDITKRKKAENEILASAQQLRATNEQLMANELEREKLVKTLQFKNKELRDIVYTA